MTTLVTARNRAKAERSEAILREAARLFAEHGYHGVSLEEIGTAVGVSGPAVYRHFSGKQALLGAVLVRASEELVALGTKAAHSADDPVERMQALIGFHVRFALRHTHVIRVHDRDFANLSRSDYAEVRRLRHTYVSLWVDILSAVLDVEPDELTLRVHACFGLIHSTPHSSRAATRRHAATAKVVAAMAESALCATV